MNNVIWLHLKYPNKNWAIHHLARKVAEHMIEHRLAPETIVTSIPLQYLENQFFQEVERQAEEMSEEYE